MRSSVNGQGPASGPAGSNLTEARATARSAKIFYPERAVSLVSGPLTAGAGDRPAAAPRLDP
jgi:hypothetical protein